MVLRREALDIASHPEGRPLLTRYLKQLEQIRRESHVLDTDFEDSEVDETPDNSPDASPPEDHNAFIFGYRSADVDLRSQHPLPSHIPFLWQIYQENVEPLLKILHVPTTDKLVREMRRNMDDLSPANEALMFSIYYAAVISLEDEEVGDGYAICGPAWLDTDPL